MVKTKIFANLKVQSPVFNKFLDVEIQEIHFICFLNNSVHDFFDLVICI